MGGRGFKAKKHEDSETWKWLRDVDDKRLENYIKRSNYLENKADPQGRSIHDVAYHAEKELARRNQ